MVFLNDTLIAGTRSNEMQTEAEMIEISSPTTGGWRNYIAGRKGWTVNTGFLLSTVGEVERLLSVGEEYTLLFADEGHMGLQGTAILKTCKITATVGNLIQGSFSFQGTSSLVRVNYPPR